ncbi:MAG: T9SS C-terminal target domain-containing protein [Bacteroidetes bacterium]|nr:MAG: T9SS C-terminal target domain-containing protein [Bacteroidota bacterium]
MNIQAGTVIKALAVPSNGDNTSALIITRDAQIFAEGSANAPIIFTAEDDDVTDPNDLTFEDRGLWGGVLILGNATIAFTATETQIEGIDPNETRARFGGTDDADNSGVFKYVSIRHGGAALTTDNEINGLTLGGVGSGTTIDYVEVYANDDDGIEWFGGSVNCSHLVCVFNADDAFDMDLGWHGHGQFWFSIMDPNLGDHAGEFSGSDDNEGIVEGFDRPQVYNMTLIGRGSDVVDDNKQKRGIHLKTNAGGVFANSIFTEFANEAIELEFDDQTDLDPYGNLADGSLVIKNNIWYKVGAQAGNWTDWNGIVRNDHNGEALAHLQANNNEAVDPQLAGISWAQGSNGLDPRPDPNGPAYQNVASVPSNPFFIQTNFRGAFGSNNWANDWTNLFDQGFFGVLNATDLSKLGYDLVLSPNVISNENMNVTLTVPASNEVNLRLFNMNGQLLETVLDNVIVNGESNYSIEAGNYPNGLYFLTLTTAEGVLTQKFAVQR